MNTSPYKINRTTYKALAAAGVITGLTLVAAPAASPATTAPAATAPATCPAQATLDTRLVPSCGVLFGAAPRAGTPQAGSPTSFREFEGWSGRPVTLVHRYYGGGTKFPNANDVTLLREPGKKRVLLATWKVDEGMTWAQVAAGKADARIDAWAAHLRSTYTDKFLLTLHHEPEESVNQTAGSGRTAADYRAMWRHVVARVKAKGVTNAVYVWQTMGYYKWIAKDWYKALYPGDDIITWIAWDPYVQSIPGDDRTFDMLLNRGPRTLTLPDGTKYNGAYNYFVKNFPGKPLMLAEYGYQHTRTAGGALIPLAATGPGSRASFYANIDKELSNYPQLKAMAYFNNHDGTKPTHVGETSASLAEWKKLATDSRFPALK